MSLPERAMRPDRRTTSIVALLATGVAFAGCALADDSREWLERMNTALMTRSYVGDFFHVQDGRVEALRIIHRVEHGEVRERLMSLDGSGREFIRTGTELACYLPDKKTVLVEQRPPGDSLLGNLPAFDQGASEFYDLHMLEPARLMGRAAQVISVTPHDQYRYGYRLWIDRLTAMPLKTQLCDERGNVIEQVVFAHITLPDRIPDSDFVPGISTQGFHWLRHAPQAGTPDTEVSWEAPRLPPGFRMTARAAQPMPGSNGPVTHLVFTDGLASVSVFIESAQAPVGVRGEAMSRVGSSSAFSTVVDGHQVTAVGEVPPETVRYIASSVQQQMRNGHGGGPVAPPPGPAVEPPGLAADPGSLGVFPGRFGGGAASPGALSLLPGGR